MFILCAEKQTAYKRKVFRQNTVKAPFHFNVTQFGRGFGHVKTKGFEGRAYFFRGNTGFAFNPLAFVFGTDMARAGKERPAIGIFMLQRQ